MKIETFKTENVAKNGKVKNGGAVVTKGAIYDSAKGGGCGQPGCPCSEGFWISVIQPLNNEGVVECVKFTFETEKEKDKFIKKISLLSN